MDGAGGGGGGGGGGGRDFSCACALALARIPDPTPHPHRPQVKKLAKAPWKFEQQTHDDLEAFQMLNDHRLEDAEGKVPDPPPADHDSVGTELEAVYPDFHHTSDMIIKVSGVGNRRNGAQVQHESQLAVDGTPPAPANIF